MRVSFIVTALAVLVLACLNSCTRVINVHLRLPEPRELNRHFEPGEFLAGAARVDITPMPGYPMGGHAIGGTTGRGYWTRLYARAIYLEDATGTSLVLVSCDLWSMPGGLADRVAEIVRADSLGEHIGREEIILAATHTHQSPGNFSTNEAHNTLASHRVGFDIELFEFLADRIASAILQASKQAKKQEKEGEKAWVFVSRSKAERLFRNRSLDAFVLNKKSSEVLSDGTRKSLPRGAAPSEVLPDDAYKAVDPWVTVLRVTPASDKWKEETIAMAVFLAVHPEAMSNLTQVYSADLFGVAASRLERALRRPGHDQTNPKDLPVVAFFNGAEGDISPDWWPQGRLTTTRLAEQLAKVVFEAKKYETKLGPLKPLEPLKRASIECRYRMIKIADCGFPDPEDSARLRRTAKKAMLGVAMLGGAEDGRSFFYDVGWIEGVKSHRRAGHLKYHWMPGQSPKQPGLDFRLDTKLLPGILRFPLVKFIFHFDVENMTENFVPGESVPTHVPIGIYKLGSIVLATLPGEATFIMGRRIARAIEQQIKPNDGVLLIGLANEYLSYFATPEEYEAQHYEGASTLYGPASGPLLQYKLTALAEERGKVELARKDRRRRYDAGLPSDRWLRDVGDEPYYHDDGLEEVLERSAPDRPARDLEHCIWYDVLPKFAPPLRHLEPVNPYAAIEMLDGENWEPLFIDGIREDDQGTNFVTVNLHVDSPRQWSKWAVMWLPPGTLDQKIIDQKVWLRIVVTTLDRRTVYSDCFTLTSADLFPERCPWDLDGNGTVGAADLILLWTALGTDPGGPPDFDRNGNVGASDLLALLANWGPYP